MRRALCGAGVVLFVAACGGGGEVMKADYVREANAVCRDAAERVDALEVPGDRVADVSKAATAVVKVQRAALERIRDIEAPEQDRPEIAKWIALVDQTVDQAEVSAKSQADGDFTRAMTANVNGAELNRRADELARRYGLRPCVQAATAPTTDTTEPDSTDADA